MRVLTLGRGFPEPRSGMNGSFEWEQATALARRGIDVTYCYLDWFSVRSNRRIGGRRWRQDDVDIMGHNYPSSYRVAQLLSRWRARILIRDLEALIKAGRRPDVIYAHYPLWTLPLGFVRHLTERRIPLVVMEHSTWVQRLTLTSQERADLAEIAAHAHAICCVSDDLKDSLEQLLGDSADLFVIPNMVSPAFDPVTTEILPPVDDQVRFAVIGRLAPSKNVDVVLRAMRAATAHQNLALTIVGDGTETTRLKTLVHDAKLTDAVTFTGWQPSAEVAATLRAAHALVTASEYETFCVPIAEAWLSGRPVIAPADTPLRGYFTDRNGLLYPNGDEHALARAMVEFADRAAAYSPRDIIATAAPFTEANVIDAVITRLTAATTA